jgi:DNA-binding transcriptional ArsR family regulator
MRSLITFTKAMSDPLAVRIVAALRSSPLCLCELRSMADGHDKSLYSRLSRLREAGIVRTRLRGRWLECRISRQYSDLVETMFELFDEDVGWDPTLAKDRTAIRKLFDRRVDGWCNPSEGSGSSEVAKMFGEEIESSDEFGLE